MKMEKISVLTEKIAEQIRLFGDREKRKGMVAATSESNRKLEERKFQGR